jgi:hypothetical protein
LELIDIDFTGKANLAGAGFYPIKQVVSEANVQVDADFMVGHTFSTAYRHQLVELEKKAKEFKLELTDQLRQFELHKQIVWKVRSWAIIYGRAQ